MRTNNVWSVLHEFEDDAFCEHVKIIGFFQSRAQARTVVAKLKQMPGFKEYRKGFFIRKEVLDRGSWMEGFVTMQGDKAMPEPESPTSGETVLDSDIQNSPDRLWYVFHSYADQWQCTNTFGIGLYTDLKLAKRSVEDRLNQPGFRSRPSGFQIAPVTLGHVEYENGF